jgi:hypothetical protein
VVRLTLGGARVPPEFVQPRSVSLGTIKARRVEWNGETLLAEFQIPTGTEHGAYDVTAVFPGPPGAGFDVTFHGKAVFTVR